MKYTVLAYDLNNVNLGKEEQLYYVESRYV